MNLIAFYIFSVLLIAAALCVIVAKNPVHSVLFLIFSFFCTAGLFLLQGAEFLALLLVIIYVGAVAILFLFVVMMLNIELKEFKGAFYKFIPAILLAAFILFFELYYAILFDLDSYVPSATYAINYNIPNIENIGLILYTDFFLHFQMSGLILLLAMIGAVMLTLREREGVRKQKIIQQISRTREDSVKVVKVLSGKGV
ncbi:MAG: NADH-quinone oxidoreductase subunit J [Alphaproteobacteria bacterium]|jgi:NADH-quinone oxidoreductase subunit J|nr:NADH-quinone oxidoreductase subunit J [Alphaproteobacteria bacterium]MBT5828325.1 NADH-quinone oxidoreductase subunit J [Alphaproteobacteria bacterium]